MPWKRPRRCCLTSSSLPIIPANGNRGHNGTGNAIPVWTRPNIMDARLRWNNGFYLEIEKLVELSGIEPLTSTMPL